MCRANTILTIYSVNFVFLFYQNKTDRLKQNYAHTNIAIDSTVYKYTHKNKTDTDLN